ncbi:fibronectin type III domain-containing protein [bacterium]|nr:fibronectin type III domain-containing protein [bacterium]
MDYDWRRQETPRGAGGVNLIYVALALLLPLLGAGCQRSNTLGESSMLPSLEQAAGLAETGGPPGLPGVPLGGLDEPVLREVAAEDNIISGSQAWQRAEEPASLILGSSLMLAGSGGEGYSWAIYQWGAFPDGIIPLKLVIGVEPGEGDEFWLFFSDYSAGQWERRGPLFGTVDSFTYVPGVQYVSSARNTYVAFVVSTGNELTINELNLIADADIAAPAAPQNLKADKVSATYIDMSWDANTEDDIFGYNIYTGPAPDFGLQDEGVELLGTMSSFTRQFRAIGLTPEQTYHFRATAFDLAFNESYPSNTLTETTPQQEPLAPPEDLQAVAQGPNWATLDWTAPDSPQILGYNLYTGPIEDFALDGEGVTRRNEGIIYGTTGTIGGLDPDTLYYCRATMVNWGGLESPPSNTALFTTLGNEAPEVRFSVWPEGFIQTHEPVYFDPSETTDDDFGAPGLLLFEWDYENDGVIDFTTLGPEVASHIYNTRGPYTVRLDVTDSEQTASLTKDLWVDYEFDYFMNGTATGNTTGIVALDTDPAGGRIAVLYSHWLYGFTLAIRENSSWETLLVGPGIFDGVAWDLVLGPYGVGVLVLGNDDSGELYWSIYEYPLAGSGWSRLNGRTKPPDRLDGWWAAGLAVSPSGRYSVAMGHFFADDELLIPPDYYSEISVWHETAEGGSFAYYRGKEDLQAACSRSQGKSWCRLGNWRWRAATRKPTVRTPSIMTRKFGFSKLLRVAQAISSCSHTVAGLCSLSWNWIQKKIHAYSGRCGRMQAASTTATTMARTTAAASTTSRTAPPSICSELPMQAITRVISTG